MTLINSKKYKRSTFRLPEGFEPLEEDVKDVKDVLSNIIDDVAQMADIIKCDYFLICDVQQKGKIIFSKNYRLFDFGNEIELMDFVDEKPFRTISVLDRTAFSYSFRHQIEPFEYYLLCHFPVTLPSGENKLIERKTTFIYNDKKGLPKYIGVFVYDRTKLFGFTNKVSFMVRHNYGPNSEGSKKADDFVNHIKDEVRKNLLLSKRELQIVKFLAEGESSKEIANELSISKNTVDTHRQNILKKLEVRNTKEVIRIAIETGII